jgi:hypothetical protein
MSKFLIFIILLYIITCPFYIFSSGLPQPSDGIALIGIILIVITGKIAPFFRLPILKRAAQLTALITFINLAYFFAFNLMGIDNRFYFAPLFYIFDMLVFAMLLFILNKEGTNAVNYISLAVLLSLLGQVLLGLKHVGGARGALFFNNPNQLGYYSLVSLSIFAALPSKWRAMKLVTLAAVVMSAYLILVSGSRAALMGVAVLGIIIFVKEGFKAQASSIFFILIAAVLGWYFVNQSSFVDQQIKSIRERNEYKSSKGVSEWKVRGYDRFYLYPEYVLFGAGEGEFTRFKSYQQLEMHSGPGTILFSYGILGFLLFASFINSAIKRNIVFNSILLAPVFLYNFTHQGFREPLFWMLIAIVFAVSEKEYIIKMTKLKMDRDKKTL